MAYATVSDVKALTPMRPMNPSSVPNDTQVVGYLTETAAVLDGILAARGFTLPVPVTATSALELLEHYNAIGAWYLTEEAAASSGPNTKDAAERAWTAAQKMLMDGLIDPIGLGRDTVTTRARAGGSATSYFTRCMEL